MTDKERLAVLEDQMETIVGNGQPGRMDKVETKLDTHSRMLWLGMGGLYVFNAFVGLVAAGVIRFK